MEFLLFMFFSFLEGLALLVLILTLYRFKITECFWPAMLAVLVMSLQSYLFHEELSLANIVPVINSLLLAILLTRYLRVPFHWAIFATVGGYILYILLQAAIIYLTFGIEAAQTNPVKGYIVQSISAIISYALAVFLYSRGIGFAFDFDKKRFKWERAFVIVITIVALTILWVNLYDLIIPLHLVIWTVSIAAYLYFTFRKEVHHQ